MFKDIIDILNVEQRIDEDGFYVDVEVNRKTVFTKVKSVRSSEFYQAAAIGINIEKVFVIGLHEYDGQKMIRFTNERYDVVRTYIVNEFIELTCKKRDDNHE